ncbi:hypothetical protein ACLBOM_30630 [Escherichia coli]
MNKVHEGRPHIQDRISRMAHTCDIINTTSGRRAIEDSRVIRRSALQYKVHYDTTLNGGFATAMALNADATEQLRCRKCTRRSNNSVSWRIFFIR